MTYLPISGFLINSLIVRSIRRVVIQYALFGSFKIIPRLFCEFKVSLLELAVSVLLLLDVLILCLKLKAIYILGLRSLYIYLSKGDNKALYITKCLWSGNLYALLSRDRSTYTLALEIVANNLTNFVGGDLSEFSPFTIDKPASSILLIADLFRTPILEAPSICEHLLI